MYFQSRFTPNVFKIMSYRPDEFRAFFNYYDVVMNNRPGGYNMHSQIEVKKPLVDIGCHVNECLFLPYIYHFIDLKTFK